MHPLISIYRVNVVEEVNDMAHKTYIMFRGTEGKVLACDDCDWSVIVKSQTEAEIVGVKHRMEVQ